MRRRLRSASVGVIVAVGALIVPLAGQAAAAPNSRIPTAYVAGFYPHEHFAVRPAKIALDSADGGTLRLHWRRWSAKEAVGVGIAQPDHGTYRIIAILSDPGYGTFQRMTIHFPRYHSVDRLALADQGGSQGKWPEWVRLSGLNNAGGSGAYPYEPPLDRVCPQAYGTGFPVSISGAYAVSIAHACAVATAALRAGVLKCVSVPNQPYQSGRLTRRAFDGYATSSAHAGYVFWRGAHYFTAGPSCGG